MDRNKFKLRSPWKRDNERRSVFYVDLPTDSSSVKNEEEFKPPVGDSDEHKAEQGEIMDVDYAADKKERHSETREVKQSIDDLSTDDFDVVDLHNDDVEIGNGDIKATEKRKRRFRQMNQEERERWKRIIQFRRKKKKKNAKEEVELLAFQKEISRDFLLSHYWKQIAWGLSFAIIIVSSALLYVDGWRFGGGRSLLWLANVFLAFAFTFFIIQPIKVLFVAAIITYVFDFNVELASKKLGPHLFSNEYDENRAAAVEQLRSEKASCYEIASRETTLVRKMELRNITEIKSLLVDIISYVVFVIVLYIMVFGNHSDSAYYSTEVIRNLVVNADYTKSIPLTRVRSYEQFLEYLNETVIPALLTNSTDWELESAGFALSPPKPPDNAQDGFLYTKMMDRGWTRDAQIKLLGIPRLRQKRVQLYSCEVIDSVPADRRSCWYEINLFNADHKNYGVGWEPLMPGEADMFDAELLPWRYREPTENKAMPWYGRLNRFLAYGGGGYVLPLGATVYNAHLVLRFLEYFNWIDPRTRAIFIDFTTYSQDANLYNVVSIMFEVSASGVFIPSYKIHTDRLLYPYLINFVLFVLIFIIFSLLVLQLTFKEIARIVRVGFHEYFTEVWTVVDFLLCALGLVSIAYNIATILSVSALLEELDKAANNEFVSFHYAAYFDQLKTYFNAMLVFLVTVKSFRLLTSMVVFHQLERVLRDAWQPLVGLFCNVLCAVFAFSIFFTNTLGGYDEAFCTMWGSVPAMLAHTTRRHDVYDTDFQKQASLFPLYVIMFGVFLGYTSYMAVSIFNTVLAVHMKAVRSEPVKSHIHLFKYLATFVWKDSKLPPPPIIPPERQTIAIQRRRLEVVHPPYIDEVRLQGLKRETLQILTGKNYSEETALNIAFIVLSNNAKRPGTDSYYVVKTGTDQIVVGEKKVKEMKEVANAIVTERNLEISNKRKQEMTSVI